LSIDPVSNARGYRELMFQLAGEGDPSAAMLDAPATVRSVVEGAGAELRSRPAEGEWSVLELLGHMLDAEMVVGVRMRRILAEDEPPLPGFDQDDWVRIQGYNDADPKILLDALEGLRPLTVALYRGASETDRQRVGLHAERGPESFETVYRMLAGHDRFHVDQMKATLEAIRGR
jgi:hypothetical protein